MRPGIYIDTFTCTISFQTRHEQIVQITRNLGDSTCISQVSIIMQANHVPHSIHPTLPLSCSRLQVYDSLWRFGGPIVTLRHAVYLRKTDCQTNPPPHCHHPLRARDWVNIMLFPLLIVCHRNAAHTARTPSPKTTLSPPRPEHTTCLRIARAKRLPLPQVAFCAPVRRINILGSARTLLTALPQSMC